MKFLVLVLLIISSNLSFAQHLEHLGQEAPKIKEPPYSMMDGNFNKLKSSTLEFINQREKILKEEKLCVHKSTNRKDLESCLKQSQEARKEVAQNIRTEIAQRKTEKAK